MRVTKEQIDLIGFTNQQAHFNKVVTQRLVNLEIQVQHLDARGLRYSRWLLIILIADIAYFGYKLFNLF